VSEQPYQAPKSCPCGDAPPERRILPAQREVLRKALADAVSYQDPPLHCSDCEALGSLCGQCGAGLSQARAYLTLSRELGISEVNARPG
jgi:hypothetical protein